MRYCLAAPRAGVRCILPLKARRSAWDAILCNTFTLHRAGMIENAEAGSSLSRSPGYTIDCMT